MVKKVEKGKTIKSKSVTKGKSIPDIVFQNSLANLNNIIELRDSLEKENYIQDIKKDIIDLRTN